MAKKRRKPQNRSRNRPSTTSTRTAERPHPAGSNDASELDGAERAQPKTEPRRQRPTPPSPRPPAGPQRSRAEKKELARAEREAARRRIARAQRPRQLVWLRGVHDAVAPGGLI